MQRSADYSSSAQVRRATSRTSRCCGRPTHLISTVVGSAHEFKTEAFAEPKLMPGTKGQQDDAFPVLNMSEKIWRLTGSNRYTQQT